MNDYHIPVLLEESIEGLSIKPDGIYVDVTFGGGGHSRAILKNITTGKLIAFDQDDEAKKNTPDSDNFIFIHNNFRYLQYFLKYLKIDKVDGILADLGVSSHHFDESERGFSFKFDTELDMRMNRNKTLKASDIVNQYSPENLTQIFKEYGEVEKPWAVAQAIVNYRQENTINTTGDLLQAINDVVPERFRYKSLARIYQALRIEVNDEIGALKDLLEHLMSVLTRTNGVITYHSLEDRLVKISSNLKFEGVPNKDFMKINYTF